jgi:DNA-binding IscR family transcriptional regulator
MGVIGTVGSRKTGALALKLVYAVARNPGRSARMLAEDMGVPIPGVSARLADLRLAGLVRSVSSATDQTVLWYPAAKKTPKAHAREVA